MALEFGRAISDPVHGTIRVTRVENAVLDTRSFQRLRNVAQLGLASLVFPGANFSRFSHSLGACHIAGRVLDRLRTDGPAIPPEVVQKYRLAALLHDVGHYPFSHAFEHALDTRFSELFLAPDGTGKQDSDTRICLDHEGVGEKLIEEDPEISRVLREFGFDPREISDVVAHRDEHAYANLISSDLDVDRIDYLMRTSLHTGLPYGRIDLDYLISQMALDATGRVCLKENAERAADHFLLGRVFDRLQVAWHKTVAALEQVLQEVISKLLPTAESAAGWSKQGVTELIRSRQWAEFDDAALITRVRAFASDGTTDAVDRAKALAILYRRPPKLIGQIEEWGAAAQLPQHAEQVGQALRGLKQRIPEWAKRTGVPEGLWSVWLPKAVHLTEWPLRGSAERDAEAQDKEIHLLDRLGNARRLLTDTSAMTSQTWTMRFWTLRLYVLLTPDQEGKLAGIREVVTEGTRDLDLFGCVAA